MSPIVVQCKEEATDRAEFVGEMLNLYSGQTIIADCSAANPKGLSIEFDEDVDNQVALYANIDDPISPTYHVYTDIATLKSLRDNADVDYRFRDTIREFLES